MKGNMICQSKHISLGDGGLLRFGTNRGFSPAIKERNRSPPFGNYQVALTISNMI